NCKCTATPISNGCSSSTNEIAKLVGNPASSGAVASTPASSLGWGGGGLSPGVNAVSTLDQGPHVGYCSVFVSQASVARTASISPASSFSHTAGGSCARIGSESRLLPRA